MTQNILLISTFLFSFINLKAQNVDPDLAAFDVQDILKEMDAKNTPWVSFFEGQNLFTGIYRLNAGAEDKQQPHKTDEVYYVISGKAKLRVGDESTVAEKGKILFVKAGADHSFLDIEEELVLLVFFDKE